MKRDNGGDLAPRTAAALLDQTALRTRRQLDLHPPLLMFTAAAVVLVAYGSVWLSVHDQHPYDGPSLPALAVVYGTIAVWCAFVAVIQKRAVSGISGRSARRRRGEGIAFGIVWVMVYVFQGAVAHAGVSHAIVSGIYPAAAPLVVVGGAAAAQQAAPSTVWAVIGIGLACLLLARAASRLWLHR